MKKLCQTFTQRLYSFCKTLYGPNRELPDNLKGKNKKPLTFFEGHYPTRKIMGTNLTSLGNQDLSDRV